LLTFNQHCPAFENAHTTHEIAIFGLLEEEENPFGFLPTVCHCYKPPANLGVRTTIPTYRSIQVQKSVALLKLLHIHVHIQLFPSLFHPL